MTGSGTAFFTNKRSALQATVTAGQAAQEGIALANQALAILAKPTAAQAEAEQLVELAIALHS